MDTPTLYQDHLDAIVRFYENKKRKAEMSPDLLNPTRNGLRRECLAVYNARFHRRDLPILKPFFQFRDDDDIAEKIAQFGLDKFRPLENFLNGITSAPDRKNIELLGWLVNFPIRQFDPKFNYESLFDKVENIIPDTLHLTAGNTSEPGKTSVNVEDSVRGSDVEPGDLEGIEFNKGIIDKSPGRKLTSVEGSRVKSRMLLLAVSVAMLCLGYWGNYMMSDGTSSTGQPVSTAANLPDSIRENPPVSEIEHSTEPITATQLYNVRCQARTLTGRQCKRNAKLKSNYCWQHKPKNRLTS